MYEFSKSAITRGEAVAGVVYNYLTDRAKTIVVHSLDEIEAFRGTKYIQSYTVDAYKQLIDEAINNIERNFLVFGTPCQIYGFASVLEQKRIRNRFILVDLFCHGVPSYLVWDNYIKDIKRKTGKLIHVIFRDKSIGWHNFVMRIQGQNEVYQQSSEADWFYRLFFDNVMLSKACFYCPVRQTETMADIRIGDCWGIRYQDREDGVSTVICFSECAESYVRKTENIVILDVLKAEEVLQAQSVKPYKEIALHDHAFADFKKYCDIKKTVKLYRKQFSYKRRIKTFIKETTSYLPDKMRAKIRKCYKKRRR